MTQVVNEKHVNLEQRSHKTTNKPVTCRVAKAKSKSRQLDEKLNFLEAVYIYTIINQIVNFYRKIIKETELYNNSMMTKAA